MAGAPEQALYGGMVSPTLTTEAPGLGRGISLSGIGPHHGVIGVVLIAVAVLILLDRAGFRFAVTAGKR